jgi:hypothetical protein
MLEAADLRVGHSIDGPRFMSTAFYPQAHISYTRRGTD